MKRSSNLSKTSQLITGRGGHNTQMWMGVIVNIRDQLVFGLAKDLNTSSILILLFGLQMVKLGQRSI